MPSTTLTISLTPQYTAIHVSVDYVESGWGTTVRSGYSEVFINGEWHRATALFQRRGEDGLEGWILGLEENIEYDVRVTFIRYDATSLSGKYITANGWLDAGLIQLELQTQELSVTTKNSNIPIPGLNGVPVNRNLYVDCVNGNNSWNGLSPTFVSGTTGPKRDIGAGGGINSISPGPGAGDIIHVINGVGTNWDTSSRRTFSNRSGSDTAYLRIKGYNDIGRFGGWEYLNGPWTLESGTTNVYWMTTTRRVGLVVDDTLDTQIYPYRGLDAADETVDPGHIWSIKVRSEPGFYIKDSTDRIYVKLADPANPSVIQTVQPQNNRLKAGYRSALIISNCDKVVINNAGFDIAGLTDGGDNPLDEGTCGLTIENSTNIVVRNNDFQHANIELGDNAPLSSNILIEDNVIFMNGAWEVFMDESVNNPYNITSAGWSRCKNHIIDRTAINVQCGKGVTIRRNIVTGWQAFVVSTNNIGTDVCRNINVLNNTLEKMQDDGIIEFEGVEIGIGAVVAFNNLTNTHNFFGLTDIDVGPILIVSNTVQEYLFSPFKIVSNTNSRAYVIVLHNTILTERESVDDKGSTLRFIDNYSGLIAVNNVIQSTPSGSTRYLYHCPNLPSVELDRINYWENNYHYFTPITAGAIVISHNNVSYTTFSQADAAIGLTQSHFVSQTTSLVNPYPNGIDNLIISTATGNAIPGITNIAADQTGNNYGAVFIGHFAQFAYPELETDDNIIHPTIYAALFNSFDIIV